MKALASAVLLAFAAATLAGCATAPAAGTTSSAVAVVDALRAAGLAVEDAGTVEQPFFPVPARVYVVDGRDLQLYEFASAADAERAATQVAPSGSPIGTTMVSWMAAPHFFHKDRLIVNYIGASEQVLAELQRLLGPQFAGQ